MFPRAQLEDISYEFEEIYGLTLAEYLIHKIEVLRTAQVIISASNSVIEKNSIFIQSESNTFNKYNWIFFLQTALASLDDDSWCNSECDIMEVMEDFSVKKFAKEKIRNFLMRKKNYKSV